jgi:hypothetical protein
MAHTAEEKIKILYEDSLHDIRQLTERLEIAVKTLASTKSAITSSTEFQLAQSIKQIEILALSISTSREGIEIAASSVVKDLLLGEGGPVKKLNDLFLLYQHHSRQSMTWVNIVEDRHKKMFSAMDYILLSGAICGLVAGVVAGAIVKLL